MRTVVLLISGLTIGLGIGLGVPDLILTVGARTAAPSGAAVQRVDRAHKGDRLDVFITRVGKQPAPPQTTHKLLDGCEPAASTLSPSAEVAGRCAV